MRQELLDDLRAKLVLDDAPPEVIAAARSSYTWRTIDAELATLRFDSAVDAAPVRGSSELRLMSFVLGDRAIDVQVVRGGRGVSIIGQVAPVAVAEVEVRRPSGATSTTTDERGTFAVDDLEPGPVSFSCRIGDRVVQTEWFTI